MDVAKANAGDVRQFDTQVLAVQASHKAHLAVDAKEQPTGKYTVILEPAAALDRSKELLFVWLKAAPPELPPLPKPAVTKK